MSENITYGYGFNVDDVTVHTFLTFLENHAASIIRRFDSKGVPLVRALGHYMDHPNFELFNRETTNFKDYDLPEDLYEELQDALSEVSENDHPSFKDVIKEIIVEETGFDLCFETGRSPNGLYHTTIMFAETFPWNYDERNRNLSRNELHDTLKTYMQELGLTGTPDYTQSIYDD